MLTKNNLSQERAKLLELLQKINFGRIEMLRIRNGEPVFDPPPRLQKFVKFGAAENGTRPELAHDNFLLKKQVRELLYCLAEIDNGKIDCLEVKHGLPFSMEGEIPM